jgi:DNA-binding CsgD family transcriptional regulator
LAEIDEVIIGARPGPRVLLVDGPAGVGKTALLTAARERATARGMPVFHGRGSELERHASLGVMRELSEPALRKLSAAKRAVLSAGAAAPAVHALLADGGAAAAPGDLPFVLVHAFFWLVASLTERAPALICVDDLQWVDRASLRALAYVTGRADELSVAIVLAQRSGEPGTPPEVAALREDTRLRVIAPAPLSPQACARLVREALGASAGEAFCSACHHATGGNPFLIGELLRDITERHIEPDDVAARGIHELLPESVLRTTTARIRRQGPASVAVARALAVLEVAEPPMAARLADLDDDQSAQAAAALTAAGVLKAELPLSFAHPLQRAAVYAELAPAERERAHHRAASLLQEPPAVASHLLRSSPRGEDWAVDALLAVGRQALAEGSPEDSRATLVRAVAERPADLASAELLLALARAEMGCLDPNALESLETALTRERDPAFRAGVLSDLASARYLLGDVDTALQIARQAIDEIAGRDDAVESALIASYVLAARASPAHAADVGAFVDVPRDGPSTEATRLVMWAFDGLLRGKPSTRVRASLRLGLSGAHGVVEASAGAHTAPHMGAWTLAGIDDFDAAETITTGLITSARRSGSAMTYAVASELRAWARWRQGMVPGALADYDAVLGVAEVGWAPQTVTSRIARSDLLLELGDLAGAIESIDIPPDLEARLAGIYGYYWLPYGRSGVARAQGDHIEALAQALLCGERMASIDATSPAFCPWRSRAALAASALGDHSQATELALEELRLAREIGSPRATGIALRTTGLIEGGERGLELLADAVTAFDGTQIMIERARTLVEFGAALRRARRPRDAREPLSEAHELARRCGATALIVRARDELLTSGARPRRDDTRGPGALTPRELRVAELAGEGLSNPEIAQALFVSRRTVESHLHSIYPKLDIPGREQLAEALGAAR